MILNVYKPKNWTSFDVVAKVRSLAHIKKVGHAGTLDPLAEGVLLVLTENDTKKQDSFKDLPKEYYFEFIAGVRTPSADLETLPELVELPNIEKITQMAPSLPAQFIGEIIQTAPIFSAKKVNGKRLYAVARSNNVQIQEKTFSNLPKFKITIYELIYSGYSIQTINTNQGAADLPVFAWSVKCSSGTYVRTLAEDLALKMGSSAVVSKLVRTAIGDYKISDSIAIEDLKFS